jgi:hypothetical protein
MPRQKALNKEIRKTFDVKHLKFVLFESGFWASLQISAERVLVFLSIYFQP